MGKSRQNSNVPNRLSVADRTELLTKTGTREGEVILQRDIGLLYAWTDTQGTDNGGTVLNVGTGSWLAQYDGVIDFKWFNATKNDVASASANGVLLDNFFSLGTNLFIDGKYYTDRTHTLLDNTTLTGSGIYTCSIINTETTNNVLEAPLNATGITIRDLSTEHQFLSSTNDGIVFLGNNNTNIIERVRGINHNNGINLKSVQWNTVIRDCRMNTMFSIGYVINSENAAGLTSIHLDRCYATDVKWHSKILNVAELLFTQPIMDITTKSLGMLEINGCQVINILSGHVEGTSGTSIGDIIKIGSSATKSIFVNGFRMSPDCSAATEWRMIHLNFADNAQVFLDSIDSSQAVNLTRSRISTNVSSTTKLTFGDSNSFGVNISDTTGTASGPIVYREYSEIKDVLARGVATVQSGAVVDTGLGRRPENLMLQIENAAGTYATVYPSYSDTTSGGVFTARFTRLSDGLPSTGITYTLNWASF